MLELKQAKTPQEIADAKSVRIAVFQKEQGIAQELDFDNQDDKALHFIAYEGTPIGVARVRFPKEPDKAKVERFAVLLFFRHRGIGRQIMTFIENTLSEQGVKQISLDAQEHAKDFYEKLGYKQEGDTFEEVGIPHIKMVKTLT